VACAARVLAWRQAPGPGRAQGKAHARVPGPLAAGRDHQGPSTPTRSNPRAETYSGEFYCVKCKEKRQAEGQVVETNGRRMAKGKCPVCGTNLNRILGKA
jgi:hypothetical protein